MTFLLLLSAHFLADFPLQGEWMAKEKYKVFKTQLGTLALIGHAFIHALVLGVAGSLLGLDFTTVFLLVGGTHFFIDLGKIKGYYDAFVDQLLHFVVLLICLL